MDSDPEKDHLSLSSLQLPLSVISELPLSQIPDPISDSYESERARLELEANHSAHLLRLELSRLEEQRRKKEQEDRITRLVDAELSRLRQSQAERDLAEKKRLESIYRSFLIHDHVPVFQTSTYLCPSSRSPLPEPLPGEALDIEAILRRNQRRLLSLNNM